MFWTWNSSPKWNGIGKFCDDSIGNVNVGGGSAIATHGSTVERLYAWEKKLYDEVKVGILLQFQLRLFWFSPLFSFVMRVPEDIMRRDKEVTLLIKYFLPGDRSMV